ncbi:hypothetical protein E2320_015356 [Naja naja]|nr:hypothetical protein E2320_015356 [Naja naja]
MNGVGKLHTERKRGRPSSFRERKRLEILVAIGQRQIYKLQLMLPCRSNLQPGMSVTDSAVETLLLSQRGNKELAAKYSAYGKIFYDISKKELQNDDMTIVYSIGPQPMAHSWIVNWSKLGYLKQQRNTKCERKYNQSERLDSSQQVQSVQPAEMDLLSPWSLVEAALDFLPGMTRNLSGTLHMSWCKREKDSLGDPALKVAFLPHIHTLFPFNKALGKHLVASWAAACLSCKLGEVQEGNASPVAMLGEREEESGEEEGKRGSRRNRKQEEEEEEEAEAGIAKGAGGGRTWNSVVASQLQAQLPENLYCLRAGPN